MIAQVQNCWKSGTILTVTESLTGEPAVVQVMVKVVWVLMVATVLALFKPELNGVPFCVTEQLDTLLEVHETVVVALPCGTRIGFAEMFTFGVTTVMAGK